MKSDESAFSIVPSRMSSRVSLSTIQTSDRDRIRSSESLVYRQLNFEDDLFTARVYKRNYRTSEYQGSHKQNPERDIEAVDPRNGNPKSSELANLSVLDQTLTISDRNISTDQKYKDFIRACRKGDKDEVSKVLKTSSIDGGTMALSLLLSRKCDSVQFCPIHATVFGGHLDVMEILLQRAPSEYSENLGSLLFCRGTYVVVHGHKQPSGPPLHVAAYNGELSMVQLLLRTGAPINAESDHGVQAIHLAAKTGSIEVLAVLIAAGAILNCRDYKRRQPMHYSSQSQRPEVIKYLAKKGADIDGFSDTNQITPLGFACKKGIDTNVKALLSLGALVTSPILDTAVRTGSPGLVQTLLISVANQGEGQSVMATSLCNYVDADLNWSLYWDYESWERRKLRLLLEYTDLLLKDRNGETVLYGALNALRLQHGKSLGLMLFKNIFLLNLSDSKTLEEHEAKSIVRREEEAISAAQTRFSSDASALLENMSESTVKPVKDEVTMSSGEPVISAPLKVEHSLGWN